MAELDTAGQSLLRRITSRSPIIVATYVAASVALGYGFASPLFDAVALAATGTSYLATEAGMSRLQRSRALS